MNNSKWSSTNQIPRPISEDLLRLSSDGINELADALYVSAEVSPNEFAISLELVNLLLRAVADRIPPEKTLGDFLG